MKNKPHKWSCVNGCGACCRLAPEESQEAIFALSEAQLEIYMKMVGEDGWCIHYDTGSRRCNIYSERPDFCRVSNLHKLFDVEESNANSFAIECCQQQIKSIYGSRSLEIRRFNRQLRNGPINE